MKTTISLALAAAACVASSATIEIRFSTEAPREVWVLDETPDRMPISGRAFDAKSFTVETTGASQVIVVHEPKSASVAIKKAGDVTGSWTVDEKEWRAAEVKVQAFTRGKPLEEGRVELHAPNYTKTMPVEDGEATFFAVPYGEVEVRVDYKGGGIPATAPQIFRIERDAPADERVIGVTVVPGEGVAESADTAQEAVPEEQPHWFGRLAVWLFGLAAGVVVLVLLYRQLRDRSDQVEGKLRGLGVPIPGDLPAAQQDDTVGPAKPFDPAPVVPDGHCAYCGKPQAECICRLDAPRASAPSAHGPTLVGAGVELRIPEGESVVGREGDLAIQDATVSRRHAKIVRTETGIVLTDLGSSNGTFVDGVRVEGEVEVSPGSVVHFGSVRVRLEG